MHYLIIDPRIAVTTNHHADKGCGQADTFNRLMLYFSRLKNFLHRRMLYSLSHRQALGLSVAAHLSLATFLGTIQLEKITGLLVPKTGKELEVEFDLVVEQKIEFGKDSNAEDFTNQDNSYNTEDLRDSSASTTNGTKREIEGNTTTQKQRLLLASLSTFDQMKSPFNFTVRQVPADLVGAFSPIQGIAPDTKSISETLSSGLLKVNGFGRGNCPPKSGINILGLGNRQSFSEQMTATVATLANARTYDDMLKVGNRLESLTERYPNKWLAAFWTGYAYSQCAILSLQNTKSHKYTHHLNAAQSCIDKAWKAHDARTMNDQSGLHALQANIYSLRARQCRILLDNENESEFTQLYAETVAKAEDANPGNAMVLALKAVIMLNKPATQEEGRRILRKTLARFEGLEALSSMRPRFDRKWMDFWLSEYGLVNETEPDYRSKSSM